MGILEEHASGIHSLSFLLMVQIVISMWFCFSIPLFSSLLAASKTPPSLLLDLRALISLAVPVRTDAGRSFPHDIPEEEDVDSAGAFLRANSAFASEMRLSLWLYSALAALNRSRADIED
jgi:hypothetical protein